MEEIKRIAKNSEIMGRILTNYPPALPLTPKQKREREADQLLNQATKSIWVSVMMHRIIRFFIGIYVRLVYAKRALKQIRHPHLGDKVFYWRRWHYLNQGVNRPYWDLWQPDTKTMEHCIHESKFTLQPLWRRFRFSFMFTYKFFMTSWYSIDVQNRGRFIFDGKLFKISRKKG